MYSPTPSYGEKQMHKLLFGASKTCANCGQGGASISCHQKCGEAYYCEDSCRSNHASAHRRLCVTTREFGIEDGSDTESEREDQQDASPQSERRWAGAVDQATEPAALAHV